MNRKDGPTSNERKELINAFYECSQFRIKDTRDAVCSSLPSDIQAKLQRSEVEKVDVSNIIIACWEHQYPNSIDYLLEALFTFEGNSNAWKNLSNLWIRIRPPESPELRHDDKQDVVSDKYVRVGEHICINRRWECTTFDHMRTRDGRIPQRILAFQVPGGKGKSLLLKRFNYVCQIDASKHGKNILYARIDFRDLRPQPNSFVQIILNTFLENVAAARNKLSDNDQLSAERIAQLKDSYIAIEKSLKELKDKIKDLNPEQPTGQRQSAMSELQLVELASEMHKFCHLSAHKWTIVLILDTFEDAGAAGDWVVKYYISKIVEIDNVIVVLAGRRGLSALENRSDEVIFRSMLKPMKYPDDCQRWAGLKYGFKISEKRAKRIINEYDGDLQQIDMVLKVIRDFPDLITPEPN